MSSRLTLLRGGAVHLAVGESVERHATQAWKLVVALEGRVRVEHAGVRSSPRAVLVAPYVEQSMAVEGASVAFFAEPGTRGLGHAGAAPLLVPDAAITERLVGLARATALGGVADDEAATDEAFASFGGSSARLDRRAEGALRRLAGDPSASVESVAGEQRLSATRLRHLVHDATGFSLRAHRLWHRTLHGVEAMLVGQSIGASAARAGFADQAHFTRAFARFFGRVPSSIPRDAARLLRPWVAR